ncbi:MAG: hypothetical protein ACI4IN_07605 [Eubacterium sp.]
MKKEVRILTLATIALAIGITVSYYNTSSLGYDNANILSFDTEQINLFDYHIRYDDIEKYYKKMTEYLPEEIIVI